ncbi:hypothetical protein KQX62_12060 [Rhodopseudomonas palustris]|uniref:Uncharacterized protein n=1 Tax=Rhodopseudomonas palustris TaxID=1076 RepID=A0AAX3DSA3_RHOPL|nr:hypothetical protein [Rhodopseudomonas palustris]UYO37493.1 hypothetical protein KQX62_12060 [Rhodopseudomonas palustris]
MPDPEKSVIREPTMNSQHQPSVCTVLTFPPSAAGLTAASAAATTDIFELIEHHRRAVANLDAAARRQDAAKRAGASAERIDKIAEKAIEAEAAAAEALARTVPVGIVALLAQLAYVTNCRRAGGNAAASFSNWLEVTTLESVGAAALAWTEDRGGV